LIRKDASYKTLPPQNPVNGSYGNVPLNKTELLFRKGLKIDSAGTIRVGALRVIAELPAGSESNDAINIRALLSFALGTLAEESADYGDSLIAGVWG
jgi:CRP-like cAMP-binding protein